MPQVSVAYLIWPQVPSLLKKAQDWHLLPVSHRRTNCDSTHMRQ